MMDLCRKLESFEATLIERKKAPEAIRKKVVAVCESDKVLQESEISRSFAGK